MGNIVVTTQDKTGVTQSFSQAPNSYGVSDVMFYPGAQGLQKASIARSTVSAPAVDLDIIFEEQCLPDNPLWVRWVNRKGGWEYYMFGGRKLISQEVSRGKSFRLPDWDDPTSSDTWGQEPSNASRFVTCGASQLLKSDFELVQAIPLSPRVECYDRKRSVFVQMLVEDSKTEWDTSSVRGTIELKFKLLDEVLQF